LNRTIIRVCLATGFVASVAACDKPAESPLLTPHADSLAKAAPDSFTVAFETSKGRFVVQSVRAWAPRGVDRFYYLTTNGYYDGAKFFRNLPDFMAQFGIHGDPAVSAAWEDRNIPDDSVVQSNLRGFVSYAMGGPDTRSTQLFINKRDNSRLDAMGFAPIGRVIDGIEVVDSLYTGYGEGPPGGRGPDQGRITSEGNRYLNRFYPRLDSIISARVLKN
jgi:peptidyl-prolyl cis-trans isomerase A (cyclophilin A)